MEGRLQSIISRVHDEHREWLDHGEGVPIQRLRVEAGTIAICGDREGIDRRGRQAITFDRADGRLALLTLADEADVAAECKKYRDIPLAQKPKFNVVYRGKPREFHATSKQFLMGVCDCDGQTILVACVDGGLLYSVTVGVGAARRWICFPEPSWEGCFDVDRALRIAQGEVVEPQAPPARTTVRARPPQVDDRDDEVQEHRARLAEGVVVESVNLSILKTCFEQLHLKALLPNPAFAGDYQGRKYITVVVPGLLKAIAGGCGDLGGREKDMLKQLKEYGVVLPKGALSAVLRLFRLLGCPIVSLFEPTGRRKISRRWKLDVVAALDPKHPKHLALLKSIDTPLHKALATETGAQDGEAQGEGPESDPDEADSSTGFQGKPPGETRQDRPETDSGTPAGEQADPTPGGSEARAAADASPRRSWLSELSEPLRSFMGLTLATLTLLSQEVVRLHQRLDEASLAVAESRRHNEAPAERVVENAVITDVPSAPVDTELASAGNQPDGDELTVDLSLLRTQASSDAESDPSFAPKNSDEHAKVAAACAAPEVAWTEGSADSHEEEPEHEDLLPRTEVHAIHPMGPTLGGWDLAAAFALATYRAEDPFTLARTLMAWVTGPQADGVLADQRLLPWAQYVSSAQRCGEPACAELLEPARAWGLSEAELVDVRPRGPPPRGC